MSNAIRLTGRGAGRWLATAFLIGLIAPWGAIQAQSVLPATCITVNRQAIPTAVASPAWHRARLRGLPDSVRAVLAAAEAGSWKSSAERRAWELKRLRPLWLRDSTALEYGLGAYIAGQLRESLDPWAQQESRALYRMVSGRAEPLIHILSLNLNERNRAWALPAMSIPLDPPAETMVFGFGCDAAWLLLNLQADSTYQQSVVGTLAGPRLATGVLLDATCMVTDSYRDELATLGRRLGTRYGGWEDAPRCGWVRHEMD